MSSRISRGLLVALALTLTAPGLAFAQDRVRPISEGDGRIHGAPTIPVTESDLHPGQVQTLNLHPRYHTMLEFPFPVARVDIGDPDVLVPSVIGNKVKLVPVKVTRAETNMTIMLGDADLTAVTFHVRADSTQPFAYHVRFTDPVRKHIEATEATIASRLQADVDARVAELAELRLQQRLLAAGSVVDIAKSGTVGKRGEQLTVTIASAQQLPGDDGRRRVYVRYRVHNGTVAPLADLYFVTRVVATKRRFLLFQRTTTRELYDVQDVRTVATVPPGASAQGLLILDDLTLDPNETLSIEASGFNSQRKVRIDRVIVGEPR